MLFDTIISIIAALLLILCAPTLAEILRKYITFPVIRDLNNPWTYRVIGGLYILWTLVNALLFDSRFFA